MHGWMCSLTDYVNFGYSICNILVSWSFSNWYVMVPYILFHIKIFATKLSTWNFYSCAMCLSFETVGTVWIGRGHAIHSTLNLCNSGRSMEGEGAINPGLSLISQGALLPFGHHLHLGVNRVCKFLTMLPWSWDKGCQRLSPVRT